jgi:hypothetical protein
MLTDEEIQRAEQKLARITDGRPITTAERRDRDRDAFYWLLDYGMPLIRALREAQERTPTEALAEEQRVAVEEAARKILNAIGADVYFGPTA